MFYRYFLPSPALREYVRLLQIVHLVFPDGATLPFKPYWPRPEHCLAFSTRQPELVAFADSGQQIRKPRSALIGQPLVVTNRHVGQELLIVQVVFQPGALFRLTGLSAHELTNTLVDAEAIFSTEIQRVNERLSGTADYQEMTLIVETFLHYLINRRTGPYTAYALRPIDRVSRLMLDTPPDQHFPLRPIDWLAREACLSPKQFYRKSIERIGISPKHYDRIIRFDQAVKIKNAQPTKDWLTVALELGYYDYQHMVRDFKEFTRLTPNEFSRQESQAPERAFGIVET